MMGDNDTNKTLTMAASGDDPCEADGARAVGVARQDAVPAAPGTDHTRLCNDGCDTGAGAVDSLRWAVSNDGCLSRFDWYTGTVLIDRQTLLGELRRDCMTLVEAGHGMHGYTSRFDGVTADGAGFMVLAGGNNGAAPSVWGSGENAPGVATMLRCLPWPHRVTRADSALDFDGEGTWDALVSYLVSFAKEHSLELGNAGDWISDDAPKGRTLYVGSRKSKAFLRCYQKSQQLGDPAGTWVRVELVVRPEGDQRNKAAGASPDDLWGYAGWPRDLAPWLMGGYLPGKVTAGRRHSDDLLWRRLVSMARRHRRLLAEGIVKYGIDAVGAMIQGVAGGHDQTYPTSCSKIV
jgi:hypothetical protein